MSATADQSMQNSNHFPYRLPHAFVPSSSSGIRTIGHLGNAPASSARRKRNFYASPPESPAESSHQSPPENNLLREGPMDGDERHRRQYASSGYQGSTGLPPTAGRQSSGTSSDRYQPAVQIPGRGDTTPGMGRPTNMSEYGSYGYGAQTTYTPQPMSAGSIQGEGLQYQSEFSHGHTRQPAPPPQQQQQQHHQQHQQQQPPPQAQTQQQQGHPNFPQYGSGMVYNMPQAGPPQSPYNAVPPYQQRQSAAIDVLSNQFGVQPYFGQNEPTTGGLPAAHPSYITSQVDTTSYGQQSPASRQAVSQSYPVGMSEYDAPTTAGSMEAGEAAGDPSSYDEAYQQFQLVLREAFEHIKAGRLVKASESVLKISVWLLGHAVDLGLVRDNQTLYDERVRMWDDFNHCWLAIAQKQKDLTGEMMQSGRQPQELLSADTIEKMCDEVVSLSDKMEPHGLVDYQLGFWEEEIISALMECLELLRPVEQDLRGQPALERSSTSRQ